MMIIVIMIPLDKNRETRTKKFQVDVVTLQEQTAANATWQKSALVPSRFTKYKHIIRSLARVALFTRYNMQSFVFNRSIDHLLQ